MMPKEKFTFLRQGCLLVDPPGLETATSLHISLLGEPMSQEQRAAYLQELASEDPGRHQDAIMNLGPERSPEFLEALLRALEKNSPAAASAILRYAHDPRIRPALAAVTRRVALEEVDAFAHALSRAGGTDALIILRARYTEALHTFRGPSSEVNYDHPASRVATLAQAILRLDPDAGDAARRLVDLFDHPRDLNRAFAVSHGVEAYRFETRTEAMCVLGEGFEALLDRNDAMCFLKAAPVLAREHADVVIARCAELLSRAQPGHRHWATAALARIPYPFVGRALGTLAKWVVEDGMPTRIGLDAAALVHEFLPIERPLEIVGDALQSASPSLRLEAIHYIQHKMPDVASELLEEAIQDEPDPLLNRRLLQLLDSSRGAG